MPTKCIKLKTSNRPQVCYVVSSEPSRSRFSLPKRSRSKDRSDRPSRKEKMSRLLKKRPRRHRRDYSSDESDYTDYDDYHSRSSRKNKGTSKNNFDFYFKD